MTENVGRADQATRIILGTLLLGAGWVLLGAEGSRWPGVAALVAGSLAIDSGITRTCPANALIGRDSRTPELARQDLARARRAAMRLEALHPRPSNLDWVPRGGPTVA